MKLHAYWDISHIGRKLFWGKNDSLFLFMLLELGTCTLSTDKNSLRADGFSASGVFVFLSLDEKRN
jgi:hypothetical protein